MYSLLTHECVLGYNQLPTRRRHMPTNDLSRTTEQLRAELKKCKTRHANDSSIIRNEAARMAVYGLLSLYGLIGCIGYPSYRHFFTNRPFDGIVVVLLVVAGLAVTGTGLFMLRMSHEGWKHNLYHWRKSRLEVRQAKEACLRAGLST